MCIVEPFKACTQERKLEQWQKLTLDNWILSTIKGYKIECFKTPIQFSAPKTIDCGEAHNQIVDNEIIELLQILLLFCKLRPTKCIFLPIHT